MNQFVIYAQDSWEEVDRTNDLNEALKAIKNGARVYKLENKFYVECYDPIYGEYIWVATFFSKEAAQVHIEQVRTKDAFYTYRIATLETQMCIPCEAPLYNSDDDDLPF